MLTLWRLRPHPEPAAQSDQESKVDAVASQARATGWLGFRACISHAHYCTHLLCPFDISTKLAAALGLLECAATAGDCAAVQPAHRLNCSRCAATSFLAKSRALYRSFSGVSASRCSAVMLCSTCE